MNKHLIATIPPKTISEFNDPYKYDESNDLESQLAAADPLAQNS